MAKTKRYEYEEVHYEQFGMIVGDYREKINKHAVLGHSYVGFIPTQINNQGKICKVDLIFEVVDD